MLPPRVLVTGANGYIGNAVARAFSRAGWEVAGLIRRSSSASDLAKNEIRPIIGSPADLSFLAETAGAGFDVVVSNTEDSKNPGAHLDKVRGMLAEIGRRGAPGGGRPLVMFSSGCKDYGKMGARHGDPAAAPHTEMSPLNPPEPLVPRCGFGAALLDRTQTSYDATVLRPTIVYGRSSSYYGALFDLAAQSQGTLQLVGDPRAIMHSCHVDDCADAYVMLAEYPDRSKVAGQAFNIANTQYETAQQVGEALARSYGLSLEFVAPEGEVALGTVHALANFSQWVGSAKVRALTGWRERKPTFVVGIDQYRMAYEAAGQTTA